MSFAFCTILFAAMLATACEGSQADKQQNTTSATTQTSPPTSKEEVAKVGVDITLGAHATPALKQLVGECHVPSPKELAIISVLARDPSPPEDIASVLGVELPEDEFERDKTIDELEKELEKQRATLGAKVLCMRVEAQVERYDFDRERFVLAQENAFAVFEDLSGHADKQRERLALEHGIDLGETPWPIMLGVQLPSREIKASKKDAERVNDALHPAVEVEDKSAPVEDDSARTDAKKKPEKKQANSPLTALYRLAQKGGREALVAFIEGGGKKPRAKKKKDPVWDDSGSDDAASKKYVAELEKVFSMHKEKRRADAYVFFSLGSTFGKAERIDGMKGASLALLVIDPLHVVFTDTDGVAFAASSPSPTVTAATYPDLSNAALERTIERSCRGRIKRRRATIMRDGELVDKVTTTCSRCPLEAGDPNDRNARITRVLEGSFLMPGSADTLVLYSGCEPMVNLGGGALFTTRNARGERAMKKWLPGVVDDCQVFDVRDGRDRIICTAAQMGGGAVDGSIIAYAMTPSGELVSEILSPIFDTRDTCASDTHAVAVPRKTTIDNEGGSVTISYQIGTATYSGDCNLEQESLEEVEVTFELDERSGDFEVATKSKAAFGKIEALAKRGN